MPAKVGHSEPGRALYTEIVFAPGTADADKTPLDPLSNFSSEAGGKRERERGKSANEKSQSWPRKALSISGSEEAR